MKICSKCSQEKDETFYNKKGNGLQPYCKDCQSIKMREWYKTHGDVQRNSVSKRKHKLRKEAKEIIIEKKSVPCMHCGRRYEPFAMDFDHRIPEDKKFTIAHAKGSYETSALLAEIEKCDVVCAVCHRYRTNGQKYRELA